jgi:hypothetical protein
MDVVGVMRRQEVLYYQTKRKQLSHSQSSVFLPPYRPILIQWMFSVVDIFQLVPQIVPTALYYLDQCSLYHSSSTLPLSVSTLLPHDYYPLLGMTCLELAIKVHDTKLFPLEQLVRMGQSSREIKVEQVIQMEAWVMQTMGWNLHPPTPHCFVHQYGRLFQVCGGSSSGDNTTTAIVDRALQLVKRGVYSEQLWTLPPSIVAYAAMLAAMEEIGMARLVKQSFCGHMCQVTGLSAHSPGLAQAYQSMTISSTSSPTSSSPVVATPPAAARLAPQPPPQVYQQQQVVYQQQQQQPMYQQQQQVLYQQQPQVVYHQQQQFHYASPPPTTSRVAAAAAAEPSSQEQWTMQQQQQYPSNYNWSSPDTLSNTTAAAISNTGTATSCNHNKYTEQPTMIYSAGDDLGFEVTMNPATSTTTSNDLEDELSRLSFDNSPKTAAVAASSWVNGISPRQVSGAISPDRLE